MVKEKVAKRNQGEKENIQNGKENEKDNFIKY